MDSLTITLLLFSPFIIGFAISMYLEMMRTQHHKLALKDLAKLLRIRYEPEQLFHTYIIQELRKGISWKTIRHIIVHWPFGREGSCSRAAGKHKKLDLIVDSKLVKLKYITFNYTRIRVITANKVRYVGIKPRPWYSIRKDPLLPEEFADQYVIKGEPRYRAIIPTKTLRRIAEEKGVILEIVPKGMTIMVQGLLVDVVRIKELVDIAIALTTAAKKVR